MSNMKKCRNPECNKEITGIRMDCNDTCKFRYHYFRHLQIYSEDIYWKKNYKKIRKEVARLYETDKRKVPISYFEFMGIDLKFLKMKYKNDNGMDCFIVNDLVLSMDKEDNILITKNEGKWES